MSRELGRLEDLPADYVASLRELNLVPLWPNLRAVMPAQTPRPKTEPTFWAFETLRPLLMRAGELTPIEKAERRVLVLANPGHDLDNMQASAAIYLGMQLLLPGETAPSHRHTPNAVRLVVEGEGAYTTVNGQKCVMERGDLILTPTGQWHEHGHEGSEPVIWLDVLDLPLVYHMGASYHVDGPGQTLTGEQGELAYGQGGVVPSVGFERAAPSYPMLRYPWQQTRDTLIALAANQPDLDQVQVTYTNPETGGHAQNILGFYAQLLRPGQRCRLPVRSPSVVLHLVEGEVEVAIGAKQFSLVRADTCCAPGFSEVTLSNLSSSEPAFVFLADEAPFHQKMGVYENRG